MSHPDIKLPDITWITPSWTPAAHIQSVGRILRPMSLADIHARLLAYLESGRIIEWSRLNGNPKQVALVLLEERDAKLVRFEGIDFLAYRRPNPIIQFLTLGARR